MNWKDTHSFPKVVASRKKGSRKEMGPSMVVKGYFSFVSKYHHSKEIKIPAKYNKMLVNSELW